MKYIESEKVTLENISQNSPYAAGMMPTAIQYCFKLIERHFVGDSILEMGPAGGVMTEQLTTTGKRITLVEGSRLFCERLRKHFSQAEMVHALFEEFEPCDQHDNITLGHVLEHVQDPVELLAASQEMAETGYWPYVHGSTKCALATSSGGGHHTIAAGGGWLK